MAWDTAGSIISDAAVELGLGAVADPYASQDPNVQQLVAFLKSCGRDLVHAHEWTHLRGEYSFTTEAGKAAYDLPADFHNMVDQSGWNRTTRFPVGGPLSPQEWQFLKARATGLVWNVLFRPMLGKLYVYPDTNTPAGHTLAFEYRTAWWVQAKDQAAPTGDAPASKDDTILFDPLLVMRALKLAFLRAKGFDTTAAQQDFDATLERVADDDTPGRVLNLGGCRAVDAFVSPLNLPPTGYGT